MKQLQYILPKLESSRIKGQNGVIGVIGGSLEYTGAPYFSAMSALKGGADLSHIFCHRDASIIKSYSPDIIVHPILSYGSEYLKIFSKEVQDSLDMLEKWQNAIGSFVIGPGLGRNQFLIKYVVCDADFFWYLGQENAEELQNLINNSSNTTFIFTPNLTELRRMLKNPQFEFFFHKNENPFFQLQQGQIQNEINQLLNQYKVIFYLKGYQDHIFSNEQYFIITSEGSKKRTGGMGDILSGLIGVYSAWGGIQGLTLAGLVTREAAFQAYQKQKIGLTAQDVLKEISQVLKKQFYEE